MTDERQDADAAAQEFMAILDAGEGKPNAYLNKLFLKSFLKARKMMRSDLFGIFKDSNEYEYRVGRAFIITEDRINEIRGKNLVEQTKLWGEALACFLVGVEAIAKTRPPFDAEMAEVLVATGTIASRLKQLHKTFKHRPAFIQRRVAAIAKEHSGRLTPKQKKLLLGIAVQFKDV